jgi:hypothetical protein
MSISIPDSTLTWLLDSDPSIRWQVMRDLTHEPAAAVAAERARMHTEGWVATLLDRQNSDGTWGDDEGEPFHRWDGTLHTLLLLQDMGIDPFHPRFRKAIDLLNKNFTWGPHWGNPRFFEGEVEPCINGGALELGAYFGHPNEALLKRLLGEQMADGGWNCEQENGSTRSSFHTTICVLEGLLEYEFPKGADGAVTAARRKGEEYLLARGLMRSLSTGKAIEFDKKTERPATWAQFSFPNTWHYDILRGLDYFRRTGAAPDPRLADAVDLVASKRAADGRWLLEHAHNDPANIEMESVGEPSRWITLRALRVLDWYFVAPFTSI